jgi:DNA polymerase family A
MASDPKKHLLILDAETFYDPASGYTLQKMPTPNYIMDPRFELIMMAAKVDDGPHEVIPGPEFGAWLRQFDPAVTTTVTFNALFDNSILAWKYGFVPHTMIDAMGMARAMLGHQLRGASLKEVAAHLGLGMKGGALPKMAGLRREQIISMGLWDEFAAYAGQDNYLCEQIFLRLYPNFPWAERRLMDMVLRCCVKPRFLCDVPMLEAHLEDVMAAKQQLLQAANGVDPKLIMSTPKFKALLEQHGVEVEMKISPTTGEETPAFAKTDEFMETLQDHADPLIAACAAARIGLKSTLEETRTRKLISIASLPWPNCSDLSKAKRALAEEFDPDFYPPEHITTPYMPIPLRYGGAHTHRLSGEWKMNMQNMPTVRGSKGKSKLRQSLIVCEDEEVVTCDLAQIEARLVAWICGCTKLVNEFANKQDPYSLLASEIFGFPINRKLKDAQGKVIYEIEGFIGKTGILGLGYGCGKDNFDTMVNRSARSMGLDISQKYSRAIGDKAVEAYRNRYREIPRGWSTLNNLISTVWLSGSGAAQFGPCTISYGEVKLPSGLSLNYAEPQSYFNKETGYTEYRYRYGKMWHKLYGAKLLENIVQALARIVVMNAALRIRDRGRHTVNPEDYRFALQAHDELVFVVKKRYAEEVKAVVLEEMRRRPSWAPTAPIDAELGWGASYGAAK